ncbi:MAG: VCBS repeat-containing protein [Deltaproteobacteria bacterium]|nr:VCBS repeat-containing protein [Deltaproteobacteria bacterium]
MRAVLMTVAAVVGAMAGCLRDAPYHCSADEQCVFDGEVGRCELGGDGAAYCARLDPSCASWTRFDTTAGALANTCTGNALPAGRGGDPCLEGAKLPDDYAGCTRAVCDTEPSCCAASWTAECVVLATSYCGLPCTERAVFTAQDRFVVMGDDDRDGTFEVQVTAGAVGQVYDAVRWADLDGDADPEIAIGTADFNTSGDAQGIYRVAGDQAVLAKDMLTVTDGGGPLIAQYLGVDVSVGDYNADGIPDLTWIGWAPGGVTFRGRAGLAYEPGPTYGLPERDGQMSGGGWADVDGDGDTDLALADYNGPAVSIMTSDHQSLTQSWRVTMPGAPRWAEWRDVDRDGHPDLGVVGAGFVRVYRNTGAALAMQPSFATTGPNVDDIATAAAWIDADRDGDPDLAVAFNDGPMQLYRNDAGTFALAPLWISIDKHLFAEAIAAGDFDRDGLPDLVVATKDAGGFLYRNRGDQTFDPSPLPLPTGVYRGVALGPRRR